ncbi:MAG: hypothetical protein RAO94_08940 [Candidatus Stygibacter australis]|nr:hypothetical protein [Candidatus Stygibacter australis]
MNFEWVGWIGADLGAEIHLKVFGVIQNSKLKTQNYLSAWNK